MKSRRVKQEGPTVRGIDLRLTEHDVFHALPWHKRINAFFFGGAYAFHDIPQQGDNPRVAVVYVPNLFARIYFKRLYRLFHKS